MISNYRKDRFYQPLISVSQQDKGKVLELTVPIYRYQFVGWLADLCALNYKVSIEVIKQI